MPGLGAGSPSPHVSFERIRGQVTDTGSSEPPAGSSSTRSAASAATQSRDDQIRSEPEVTSSSRLASPASTAQLESLVLVMTTVNTGWAPAAYVCASLVTTRVRSAAARTCAAADLTLVVTKDAQTYAAGAQPVFTVVITNTSDSSCAVDAGEASRELLVTSGSDRIWSSLDCVAADAAERVLLLPAGGSDDPVSVTWPRIRSNETGGERAGGLRPRLTSALRLLGGEQVRQGAWLPPVACGVLRQPFPHHQLEHPVGQRPLGREVDGGALHVALRELVSQPGDQRGALDEQAAVLGARAVRHQRAALEEGGHLVRDALGRVRDQGPDPCTQVGQGPTGGIVCQGGQVGVDLGLSVAHGCSCARSDGRSRPLLRRTARGCSTRPAGTSPRGRPGPAARPPRRRPSARRCRQRAASAGRRSGRPGGRRSHPATGGCATAAGSRVARRRRPSSRPARPARGSGRCEPGRAARWRPARTVLPGPRCLS